MKKEKVFVGLSGGVDSALSAFLLKKSGYEVVGVFIKTWHPDFLSCNEEEERREAMRVAAFLDIPFLTFDLEEEYKKEVAYYMIREYKRGRTPNPDVMCNKEIKFGAFMKRSLAMGANFVATGHYAINNFTDIAFSQVLGSPLPQGARPDHSKKQYLLRRGHDASKDQSYFLWTLGGDQLKKIIFPVGGLKKTEVRKLAKKFKLPVAEKKDSQGICFLGAVDLKDFLSHYVKPKKGKVLNEKGEIIGEHNGSVFFTLGERHGFNITKKGIEKGPYYVVGKDVKKNILFVSNNNPTQSNSRSDFSSTVFELQDTNWVSDKPKEKKQYTSQIRYHGEILPCFLEFSSKNKTKIIFRNPILVAPGQSCVIYDGDVCLGGGVVV